MMSNGLTRRGMTRVNVDVRLNGSKRLTPEILRGVGFGPASHVLLQRFNGDPRQQRDVGSNERQTRFFPQSAFV
jgi:hypothetical protein